MGTSLDKALMIILAAKLTQLQASKMPKTSELPGALLPGALPPGPHRGFAFKFHPCMGTRASLFLALITIANSIHYRPLNMPETSELPVGPQEERKKEKTEERRGKGKTFVGTSLDKALMIILAVKLTQLHVGL